MTDNEYTRDLPDVPDAHDRPDIRDVPDIPDVPDRPDMSDIKIKDGRREIMGVWSYIWSIFVMLIPVIGFIIAVIWACGAARNRNRRRLAAAFITVELVICLLWAAAVFFAVRGIKKADTSGAADQIISRGYIDYARVLKDLPLLFTRDGVMYMTDALKTSDAASVAERYLKDGRSIGSCVEEANEGKTPKETVDIFVSSPVVVRAAGLLVNRNSDDAVSRFVSMVADGRDVSDITEEWLGDGDISASRAIDLLASGTSADRTSEEYVRLERALDSAGAPAAELPGLSEPEDDGTGPAPDTAPVTEELPQTSEPETPLTEEPATDAYPDLSEDLPL